MVWVLAAGLLLGLGAFAQEVLPAPVTPLQGADRADGEGLEVRFSRSRCRRPKGRPTSCWCSWMTSASGRRAPSAGPCQTPDPRQAGQERPALHPVPHHGALLAHARGAAHRPQPPLGAHRRHHGAGHGLPRLRQPDGQGHRHRRRDPQAERLEHRLVRQEPQRARLADQPGRAVRPLADRPRLRALLRLHRRRDEPVAAGGLRRHQAHRALPRQAGLQLRLRHRRPGHRVDPQPEGRRAGQAVLPLLRAGRHARPAPPEEGVDRQVQGPVRPGLGQGPRGDPRPAEEAGHRPGRTRS